MGIGLAALGVLLVVTDGNIESISISSFGAPGDVLILISALNWAVFSALSRRGLKSYSAGLLIFYVMTFGWIFTSLLFLAGKNYLQIPDLSFNGWISVAFLGIWEYLKEN